MSRKKTYIVIMQWMAFVVAVVAFLFFVSFYMGFVSFDPKLVLSNLVAVYGLLIGGISVLRGARDRLAVFYIFISIWILVVVNFIAIKF